MGTRGFAAKDRLRFGPQFREISRQGARIQTRNFNLLAKRNNLEKSRLGVTVGKKVGKAVVRNRIKRLAREFFRLHRDGFPEPIDLVVIAKADPAPEGIRLRDVKEQLEPGLQRLWPKIQAR